MAKHAHSVRMRFCTIPFAQIGGSLLFAALFALTIVSIVALPDPVASGHAYGVETVR